MPIKTKVDKIIRSMGSISIQDFIELSNFDSEGFYNLDEKSKPIASYASRLFEKEGFHESLTFAEKDFN